MARKAAELPAPKPARKTPAARKTPRDPDAAVERNQRAERRMSTGDRQSAELMAALKAKMTGQPMFPFPAELKDDFKPYWVEVVNCKPHDYFNAGDVHLLKLYCRAAADIDRLDEEIAREGSVIENTRGNAVVNPRILVRSIAETRLLTLSNKLRLQPSARYNSEEDRSQAGKKKKADRAIAAMDEDGDDGLIARAH